MIPSQKLYNQWYTLPQTGLMYVQQKTKLAYYKKSKERNKVINTLLEVKLYNQALPTKEEKCAVPIYLPHKLAITPKSSRYSLQSRFQVVLDFYVVFLGNKNSLNINRTYS